MKKMDDLEVCFGFKSFKPDFMFPSLFLTHFLFQVGC